MPLQFSRTIGRYYENRVAGRPSSLNRPTGTVAIVDNGAIILANAVSRDTRVAEAIREIGTDVNDSGKSDKISLIRTCVPTSVDLLDPRIYLTSFRRISQRLVRLCNIFPRRILSDAGLTFRDPAGQRFSTGAV